MMARGLNGAIKIPVAMLSAVDAHRDLWRKFFIFLRNFMIEIINKGATMRKAESLGSSGRPSLPIGCVERLKRMHPCNSQGACVFPISYSQSRP